MKIIDKAFFEQDTVGVARSLLGKYLCRDTEKGLVSGMIVETEAYLSKNDQACHASCGKTKRNASMFGPAGIAYVYFIYGNYYCFNVVTGVEGQGEAVLVRAVEPVSGLEIMAGHRGGSCRKVELANGPGKLCQAFAIDKDLDGHSLCRPPLYLAENKSAGFNGPIKATPRIGISSAQKKMLRFIIPGNHYLSRREPLD